MTSKSLSQKRLERDLENKCVEHANDEGCPSVKLDKVARGWPDRIFFLPFGQVLLVEFKLPGFQPRPQQAARHRMLERLNHPVSVVTEFHQFETLLAQTLDLTRPMPE